VDRVDVLEAAAVVRGPTLPPTALVGITTYVLGPPGEELGRLTVVLPSEVIRVAMPRRSPRNDDENGIDRVMPLPITLTAELGRVRMSLASLRALKPGDELDLGPVRDAVLRTGDRPTFTGEAGIQAGYRSIRIKGRIAPGGVNHA
jgi:flagellar motor switch protein FliM